MTPEQRKAILIREANATKGPWKVFRNECPISELGKEQGCTKPREELLIGTAYDHGQLDAPAPIITMAFSPFWEPGVRVSIRREDAEFMAAAREDVPALLAEVERLRRALAQVRDSAKLQAEHIDLALRLLEGA